MTPSSPPESMGRNKAFELLGTKPNNPRSSWCAVSPADALVVFTLWDNEITRKGNLLFQPDDFSRAGGKNQKQVLEKVLAQNIPAYGLVCTSRVTDSKKRIKQARTDVLIKLEIDRRRNGEIWGRHVGEVPFWDMVVKTHTEAVPPGNAVDDLDNPAGNPFPDRAWGLRNSFVRDAKVRKAVIRRAGGKCEYCGKLGFPTLNGQHYVEAHHIIALAKRGPDTLQNVIALCPDHHREAHYSADAEALERLFIKKLKKINATKGRRASR